MSIRNLKLNLYVICNIFLKVDPTISLDVTKTVSFIFCAWRYGGPFTVLLYPTYLGYMTACSKKLVQFKKVLCKSS